MSSSDVTSLRATYVDSKNPPKSLQRIVTMSPQDFALAHACTDIAHGKLGPEQSALARPQLRALEIAGLATYGGETGPMAGWRLTTAGRRQRELFLRAGRAARRMLDRAAGRPSA